VQRTLQRPVLLVCVVLIFSACTAAPPPLDSGSAPKTADSCHQPIERACDGAGCETYEVAVANTRRVARELGFGCLSGGTGSCGEFRFVHIANGFTSNTSYFDTTGKLVAAVHTTDVVDSQCHGRFTFGINVSCERIPVEGFCPDLPFPRPR